MGRGPEHRAGASSPGTPGVASRALTFGRAWLQGRERLGLESAAWSPTVAPREGLGLLSHLQSPQVAECGPARETPPLEVSPRKRLPAGLDQDPCSSRPAPEGAGASAEQSHSAGGGGWCRHCHTKLVELKRQAWKLVSGPGTPLRVSDPS